MAYVITRVDDTFIGIYEGDNWKQAMKALAKEWGYSSLYYFYQAYDYTTFNITEYIADTIVIRDCFGVELYWDKVRKDEWIDNVFVTTQASVDREYNEDPAIRHKLHWENAEIVVYSPDIGLCESHRLEYARAPLKSPSRTNVAESGDASDIDGGAKREIGLETKPLHDSIPQVSGTSTSPEG